MLKSWKSLLLVLFVLGLIVSCKKKQEDSDAENAEVEVVAVHVPQFSADSAYHFIEKQVSFGPRVPGTAAQRKCADWMSSKFKSYGYGVEEQKFNATLYNGKVVPGINIIAKYKPEAAKRILLSAHWDSRAMSDKDKNVKNKAIDGANDGASGVGVLMEIARNLTIDSVGYGVDFVLFDVEDWGPEADDNTNYNLKYGGWALGSEYWATQATKTGYSAYYGILLDMVGAADAQFLHEDTSFRVAPSVVANVWGTASQLGYGNLFINRKGGGLIDDHLPVIEIAKIPMIDIIDMRESGFFEHHHTTGDNMSVISKPTLKAVGQTLLHVLYNEK